MNSRAKTIDRQAEDLPLVQFRQVFLIFHEAKIWIKDSQKCLNGIPPGIVFSNMKLKGFANAVRHTPPQISFPCYKTMFANFPFKVTLMKRREEKRREEKRREEKRREEKRREEKRREEKRREKRLNK
ncbi:hypothetical protein llap_8891 [Limosa lapponica baueri]|uniref:Uncharacterized protein n=1 Tax=Limosa lapponica baueri TaxID=1758121 RepID=A0A2I0U3Z2_LIMLA|nr:hypothetical protein llap_8891 [Limosa lapponica baueri]